MIPIAEPCLGEQELANVSEAVSSGWISSLGKFIAEFEDGFAGFCGSHFGVSTCNGTAALHLALATLEIGHGDEVIVPSLSFVATANAVHYTGAKPVFIDSHPDYWCLDPKLVAAAITPRTKAIVPVHVYGHPCDMDALQQIADAHRIPIIEDAAEAHGAAYRGKRVGSFGKIAAFSFYGNKVITTGEGGICLTDDPDTAARLRHLRDHAMDPKRRYWHDTVGYNYRMTNLQAAVGVAQVQRLDKFIEAKRRIADWYAAGLKPLFDSGKLVPPPAMPWANSVYWLYSVLVADGFGMSRDQLAAELKERGIDSRPFFHPNHALPPYADGLQLPVAESLAQRGINLPSGVTLQQDQAAFITETLLKLVA